MSKWVMRAHFKHLRFNRILMIIKKIQTNGFWPLQLCSENLGVHLGFQLLQWEFTWECEGSFPHTLYTICTPKSMWCDSHASLLAHNLASFCLGRKPKARVATLSIVMKLTYIWYLRLGNAHGKVKALNTWMCLP
jgi:hypothetical protein